MSDDYQRIELIIGTARRRRCPSRVIAEALLQKQRDGRDASHGRTHATASGVRHARVAVLALSHGEPLASEFKKVMIRVERCARRVDEGLTAHGRSNSMWKVSDVMEVSIPSGVGYGFNVTTEQGKPLVSFAYETQEAAEAAAQQVAAALERAVLVKLFPQ
jgi:hypothetical protein